MPSGKTIRSGESAGISSALKTNDMAQLIAAFGDAKSPTLNSGTLCMSGPVFAIRVPPRLQEVIPPYYKRRKIERPTRKKSSAQGRMRVRMTGAGREYVLSHIGCCRAVLRLERNKNVGIRCADRARSVIDHVDLAIGTPDIVCNGVHFLGRDCPSNRILDQITKPRRLLDPCSRFGTDVKDELTVIAARKKVLTQPRN